MSVVASPTRNGPCPCGSGTKYKKCCRPKDEAARAAIAPAPEPRARIVAHRGQPLLISGRKLPPGVLDRAVDFYEAKDRGEGPARQMMRFVEPLLEAAGDDTASRQRALTLGTAFWNLAMCDGERRERALDEMIEQLAKEEPTAESFRAMAMDMIERHQTMFPAMHRR